MQMSENNRFFSFALDSAHVKFDVWTGPKRHAEKKAIQVQLARAWWRVLSNYSGMTRTTVQLQAHDVGNCQITAEIRPADDQSDSRILI